LPEGARIIFGLGNPGTQYHQTRHNIGFEVLDALAATENCSWSNCGFANASETRLRDGTRLIKPLSYMNRSGEVAGKCLQWLKQTAGDILVVVDDIHLPVGQLRLRQSGSAGGHNGLRSIEEHLGTSEYARLRGGVGSPELGSLSDFVLSPFQANELALIQDMIPRAVRGIRLYLDSGFEPAAEYTNQPVL
jgi:PTH1 family peptidyl-tRNA hydrolase